MQIRDYLTLYEHHCWATNKILDVAGKVSAEQAHAKTPNSYGSLHGTIFHMLDAEISYRERAAYGNNPLEGEFPTIEALVQGFKEEQALMHTYLGTVTDEDLQGVAVYEAGGKERRRIRWHILAQLLSHGTQHRAEAADILTGYGQSPGDIDFIVWVDEFVKM